MDAVNTTIYTLDRSDRIVHVSASWDQFAADNAGAEEIRSDRVLGRRLWEFVADDVTKLWLESVLMLARVRSDVLERPYRCDSPTDKRYMMMRINPAPGGVLELEHVVVREEKIEPPVGFRYAVPNLANYRMRCSVCDRVKSGGAWLEPDLLLRESSEAARSGHGAGKTIMIDVVYTVCEDCMREIS